MHEESQELETAKWQFETVLNAIIDARIYEKLLEHERDSNG
jgi:hypothetical protein